MRLVVPALAGGGVLSSSRDLTMAVRTRGAVGDEAGAFCDGGIKDAGTDGAVVLAGVGDVLAGGVPVVWVEEGPEDEDSESVEAAGVGAV